MKVLIQGLSAELEERCRDRVARKMADVVRGLKISAPPSEVHVQFGQSSIVSPRSLEARRTTDEEVDFSALIKSPRSQASLLRLHGQPQKIIDRTLLRFESSRKVYDEWGLAEIEPFPRLGLNFAGPPGTGKTLAAHYIAQRLGRMIVEVSYADVVSKYFGQAAKNLASLYAFAATRNCILFVDEAETLLSKRSASTDGADHAINSMRSQLLMLMDKTPLFTIFASNLVENYDPAFLSRLTTVSFEVPDRAMRERIWQAHLPTRLPRTEDLKASLLATRYDGLTGRQIAKSVLEAAHIAIAAGREQVALCDFDEAVDLVSRSEGGSPKRMAS